MTSMKWIAVYVVATLVALTAVATMENYWREKNYQPALIDSKELWSLQRDQLASHGKHALVFIGASRTLYGVDLPYIRDRWPAYKPVMLAINGHYPLNMLGALAQDDDFLGTVIIDIDSRGLSKYNHAMQDGYIAYYANIWSPSHKSHRLLLSYWQENMVIAGPRFGLVDSISRLMGRGEMPHPANFITERDRNSSLDFSAVNATALAENFAHGLQADLEANPPLAPQQWLADLAQVVGWVERIQRRGGKVIFYTPPVMGAQYRLAEAAYPRRSYWDVFIERNGFNGLLAEDIPEMADIELPDESHMDRSQKAAYTRMLMEALSSRGYLQLDPNKGRLTP